MNPEQMINAYVSGIRALVDPSSNIELLLGSILTAEIHLKNDSTEVKEAICKNINELLILIKQAQPVQMILAVINDNNDRYIQLISKGIDGNEINTDDF